MLVPKLWTDTIDGHRRQVRAAVLEATAHLALQHGLRNVTMSRVAEHAGIGRATLYKYFTDVESILLEWHEAQVGGHLEQLQLASGKGRTAEERLAHVLVKFASMNHQWGQHQSMGNLSALLHQGDDATRAEQALYELLYELIAAAVGEGAVRDDVPADELARFCLASLRTAQHLSSDDAVRRLLRLIDTALA